MLDFTLKDLKAAAGKILALNPDPVPRFRLLRDVLHANPASNDYRRAEKSLQTSKWIALLKSSQQPDGTWGRFHSQDTTVKQPFLTTEAAVATALACGLDGRSPILRKLQKTLLKYMDGRLCWPDPAEKHDNPQAWFDVVVPYLSAGVMAQIERCHPRLEKYWAVWAEAVKIAFQSGKYDRRKEIEALNRLQKCRRKNPGPFHVKYPLLILSATEHRLPASLERRLLDFVLHFPSGIYYIYDKKISEPSPISSKRFWGWFQAHKLLSRFRLWRELAEDAVNWIWAQRTEDGFWDLGRKVYRRPHSSFPLSESWRRPENRKIDCSVEMLVLLAECFSARG